jgi:tetratricopeptide (TPR) repeat protein
LVNEQKAIEACEAALEIEPEDAVALYNNIDALSTQERVEEAMDTPMCLSSKIRPVRPPSMQSLVVMPSDGE